MNNKLHNLIKKINNENLYIYDILRIELIESKLMLYNDAKQYEVNLINKFNTITNGYNSISPCENPNKYLISNIID